MFIFQSEETFSPTIFFIVILPPIIFESGYNLHKVRQYIVLNNNPGFFSVKFVNLLDLLKKIILI